MGAIAADADAAHIHMVVSNGAFSVSLSRCWHIGQQHSCGHDGTTTMGLGCLTNTKSILHGLTVASAALATASTTTSTTTSVGSRDSNRSLARSDGGSAAHTGRR